MSFRPLPTCLILLTLVFGITVIDSVLLDAQHTQIDFIEPTACQQAESYALPQAQIPSDNRWKYYLCDTASDTASKTTLTTIDTKTQQSIAAESGETEFSFDTADIANRVSCVSGMAKCHHAGNLYPNDATDAAITLSPNQFLIQIEEANQPNNISKGLILLCLCLLVAGIVFGQRHRDQMPKPQYTMNDAPLAFVSALILSLALVYAAFFFMPKSNGGLTPLITFAASNAAMFIGLFGTALFFICLRNRKITTADAKMQTATADAKMQTETAADDIDATHVAHKHNGIDSESPSSDTRDATETHLFFTASPLKWAAIIGFILAIIAGVFAFCINDIEMTMSDLTNEFTTYRLSLMHFAMMAGISEELLYRGVIQTSIGGRKTTGVRAWAGILIAALLFASVHIPQSTGHLFTLLPVFLVGFTSGYFRCKTQSIFPSMTMHLTYNSALMIPSLFFI